MEKTLSTRYPEDVLADMKRLAKKHERSFNGEVIWALREYIKGEAMSTRSVPAGSMFPMTVEAYEKYAVDKPKTLFDCSDAISGGYVSLADAFRQPIGSMWEKAAGQEIGRVASQFEIGEEIDLGKIFTPETYAAFLDWKARGNVAWKAQRKQGEQ